MKKIAILGSTGSIGTQTLEIVRENPDYRWRGWLPAASAALMEKQIREFMPKLAVMWSEAAAGGTEGTCGGSSPSGCCMGMDGLLELAEMEGYEILVTAVVGMIGNPPYHSCY